MLDVSHAVVEPAALEQLQECSASHHLPRSIDPLQSECQLSVLTPAETAPVSRLRPASRVRRLAA